MKKIIGISLISGLVLFTIAAFSWKEASDTTHEKSRTYLYWFQVIVDIDRKTNAYTVRRAGNTVMQGNPKQFEKALWKNMSTGKLAIGPFLEYQEALDANKMYNLKDTLAATKVTDPSQEVHWYFLKVQMSQRTKAYSFQRTAARVASGSIGDFATVLREGLAFEQLAIGPFWDYQQAESSKALYRQEE